MARTKKQSRRSISVKGEIYEKVKKYCEDHNISMSAFVEERITEYLDHIEKGTPLPHLMGAAQAATETENTPAPEETPSMSKEEIEREVSQYFTF